MFPVVAGLLIGLWIIMWLTMRAAYVGQFGRRPHHRLLRVLLVDTKKGDYTAVPSSSSSNSNKAPSSRLNKIEQGPGG